MSKPIEVSEGTFEEQVLQASQPVLVDFWAPWCAPCRRLAPIVEELAQEYEGRVRFAKLNTDENPGIAARYKIFSIPTLLVFKQGQPVKQVVGLRPKKDLKQRLDEALAV